MKCSNLNPSLVSFIHRHQHSCLRTSLHHSWPYSILIQPLLTIETTITQVPTQSGQSTGGGSGVTGGAAAGIVIGILALMAVGVGAFFFIRRRRRIDYQKQWEGSSNFGSSPGSLNRPFGTDQRLEPGMVQKRESVGSLADNQDYSRKILRVTPPLRLACADG